MFQLKWVWKNLEGCRKRYVFALCSTAVLSMMALVNSVLTAQIMDTVFTPVKEGQGTTPELWHRLVVLVSILIGFTMFRMCFNYLSVMTYETCSQKLLFKLRRDLYANMQAQDSSFFSKNRTGDLMTRLTGDLDMVRHTTCYVIRMIIDCVVLFLTTSITFLCVDWLFALAMLAVTPIIFILTKVFAKQVHPLYVDLRERLSRMNTAAQENIAGNRVVKAFAREDYEIEQFDKKNEDYRKANLKASLLWFKFSPYIDGFSQSLSIAVLLVGGSFLIMGRISIGTFALFNSLCWTLTNPMSTLGMLINDLQRFFASASKIVELYYARSTIVTRQDAVKKEGRVQGAVKFDHVTLKRNGTEVLHDINLDIKPGETIAIMGPTGCGKTSLISLIPRFSDVSGGTVSVDGTPVGMYDLKKLRGSVGIATQDVFLFSDTVASNIALGKPDATQEQIEHVARLASVHEDILRLPQGYNTEVGERGVMLSGGQKQRISIARALLLEAEILILDDALSAVDGRTEHQILHNLQQWGEGRTVIISAHRLSALTEASEILVMQHGHIAQHGRHETLAAQPGWYRDMYRYQQLEAALDDVPLEDEEITGA